MTMMIEEFYYAEGQLTPIALPHGAGAKLFSTISDYDSDDVILYAGGISRCAAYTKYARRR